MADSDDESGGHNSNAALNSEYSSREQDRFLPIANVSRIMKKALPANAKISKDAKKMVQECISEFISSITEEASDKCQREKRDTINGDDFLWAMTTLGFAEYVDPLKIYLQKLREMEGEEGVGSSQTQRDAGRGNGGAGGSGMMMGQQIYGSPQPSSFHQNHHNQTTMDGGVDRSSSSSTTTTDGRHGRI